MSDASLAFYRKASHLKRVRRAGWERCGIAGCESVADHSLGVALLALALAKPAGLNRDRCIALAIVHDLAESIVGDITPDDLVSKDEKHRREREAMEELSRTLGDRELLELWDELEAGRTPEAALVGELDVLEMAAQAVRYRDEGALTSADADRFIASARERVSSDSGRQLLSAIAQ